MSKFPGYRYDTGSKEDPEWLQYLDVLYPSPEDYQRIQNLHVIEALKKHGDNLEAPRPVSHWIYFKSLDNRAKYVARAAELGFKVTHESISDEPGAGRPYGLTLERVDRVDWNSINEVTMELFELAAQEGGEYDGWETSVEKER